MLHYIESSHNILADNLSRLHHLVTPAQIAEGKKLVVPAEASNKEEDEVYFLDQEFSGLYYDNKVWECVEWYLNLPETSHLDQNPLNYTHICELQQQDNQLLNLQLDDNVDDIICHEKDPAQPNGKIVLPNSMAVNTIKWFH
jgi:hypothetical protein